MTVKQSGQSENTKNVEGTVLDRYENAAVKKEEDLCCSVEFEERFLDLIPEEIKERDYGCGDPTRWVSEGDTVLDLGSGSGKTCYILSQKVGPEGKVIGIDFNDEMLSLARKHREEFADRIGYDNMTFVKGKIQDLALDLEEVDQRLSDHQIEDSRDLAEFQEVCERLREENPAIPDSSVDVIVSNCVLNLVHPSDRDRLFEEMKRVLKRGGSAVISDIVCDEHPTEEMKRDPELWSGCISGAFREDKFLQKFEETGFYGMEILSRDTEPWKVIEGIEFRSVTVRAFKGKEGPCKERNQAVIYRGPWKAVIDDDGHRLERGKRMAICDKTYNIYTSTEGPYSKGIIGVPPREEIPLDEAESFDCSRLYRDPRETKGQDYDVTETGSSDESCGPDCC